jgi:hypothetical protein
MANTVALSQLRNYVMTGDGGLKLAFIFPLLLASMQTKDNLGNQT